MTKFKVVVGFFNTIKIGDFVTRSMYMDVVGNEIGESTAEYYRCILQRAGYIYDGRMNGIYFKSFEIPSNITTSSVYKKAYNKK